jgi:hypothetical protein
MIHKNSLTIRRRSKIGQTYEVELHYAASDQKSNKSNADSSISVWDHILSVWETTQTKAATSGGRFHFGDFAVLG